MSPCGTVQPIPLLARCQKWVLFLRVGYARARSAKQPSSLLAGTVPHISRLAECALYSPFGLCFCTLRWCQINTVSAAQLYLPASQKLLCDIAYETCTVRKSLAIRTGPAGHGIYRWFGSSSMLPAHPCINAILIVSKISRSQFRSRNSERSSYYTDFRFVFYHS